MFAGGPTPSKHVKSPRSVVAGVAAAARTGGATALRTSFEAQNSVLAPTANHDQGRTNSTSITLPVLYVSLPFI